MELYDGFWGVSLLILLVLAVIDLMSGDFARAATAGTILFIILCWAFHSEGKKKDATKERIEALKRWYPDKPESWYRQKVAMNMDGADIAYAARLKRIELLKELEPGKPDYWYKAVVDMPEYKEKTIQMLQDRGRP